MKKNPHPTAETLMLYRQLPDDALMLMLRAFELDNEQPHLSADARTFIAGRIGVIQAEITRRTKYPVQP